MKKEKEVSADDLECQFSKPVSLEDFGTGDDFYNLLDFSIEDNGALISPINMNLLSFDQSTPSSLSNSLVGSRISPLVTDDFQLNYHQVPYHAQQNSLVGRDIQGRPIYASSQTPQGFEAMTKRKPKKSVFNFEGFDLDAIDATVFDSVSSNIQAASGPSKGEELMKPKSLSSGGEESPDSVEPTRRIFRTRVRDNSGIVATEESTTILDDLNFKKAEQIFEDIDEINQRDSMDGIFKSSNDYIAALNWNCMSPMDMATGLDINAQPTPKNPRKKVDAREKFEQALISTQHQGYIDNGKASSIMLLSNVPPRSQGHQHQQSDWVNGGPPYPLQLPPIQLMPNVASPNYDFLPESNIEGGDTSFLTEPISRQPISQDLIHYQEMLKKKMQEIKRQQQKQQKIQQSHSKAPTTEEKLQSKITGSLPSYTTASPFQLEESFQIESDHQSVSLDADNDNSAVHATNEKGESHRTVKSLAEVSKKFVSLYGKDNSMDYISGKLPPEMTTVAPQILYRIDGVSEALQVHVRRIYELIKILEILSLVMFAGDKRGQFTWKGTKDFIMTLGAIQDDGIAIYPLLAAQAGLTARNKQEHFLADTVSNFYSNLLGNSSCTGMDVDSVGGRSSPMEASAPEEFMVEAICKKFLQLFLVGMNSLTMSSAIQKLVPMEEGQNIILYNKVNATKIRRVYDVTNVLCSLNLIQKSAIPKKDAADAELYNSVDLPGAVIDLEDGLKKSTAKTKGPARPVAKVLQWTSFSPQIIREYYLHHLNDKDEA